MSLTRRDRHSERAGQAPSSATAVAREVVGDACWYSTMSPTGQVFVVRVGGEVDLASVQVLRAALSAALGRGPEHVVVDLAEVRFCSVAGLAVLVETGITAAGQGTGYAIGGASRQADRVWALAWSAAELPIRFRTAGDGVLAALAHQAGRTGDVERRDGRAHRRPHDGGATEPAADDTVAARRAG